MVATVRALGEEFTRLLGRTAAMWWRMLPWLVGFTLFGWVGYYGSVLLGSEVAPRWPWLVVGSLALGVVVQLAAIVAALRLVVLRAGVARTEGRGSAPLRVLSQTMLPFLAIYAAFGFIDDYARDVVTVVVGRDSLFGGSDLLSALNPAGSLAAALVVLAAVAGLFLLRRILERAAERTGRVWLGLVAAFVEACFTLLLLLSVFRLVDQFWLWLNDRELSAWIEALQAGLFGWLRLDQVVVDAWEFLSQTAWPVLWDLLSQPLAWLALAGVVAGFQFATTDDLIDRAGRRTAAGPSSALRSVSGVAREILAGDLDAPVLPLWQAFRPLLRAGWPLLGGFVLGFTVIDWAGDLLVEEVVRRAGFPAGADVIRAAPFVGLVPQVLVLGLQLALLGVTAARAAEITAVERPRIARPGIQAAVVILTCILVALSSLATTGDEEAVVTGSPGEPVALLAVTGTVAEPRAAASLVDPGGAGVTTDLVFVVVTIAVAQERDGVPLVAELRAGDRRYDPWDGRSGMLAAPGFTSRRDVAFEVDPADLAGPLVVRLVPTVAVSRGIPVAEVALPGLQASGATSYDSLARTSAG
ncbi:MAG: hypothetical protein REI45_02315 [Propionicimonas sp.]|nr:hypothetical protein [Propionicimonas sp.]